MEGPPILNSARPSVVRLENGGVVVEAIPRLGGRVVTLRRTDGENFLSASTSAWETPSEKLPKPSPEAHYTPFNGHVTWVGPQKDWWSQQEVNKDRLARKAEWPPDPYIEYAEMDILDSGRGHLRLQGAPSPVTGLRMTIDIRVQDDGAVLYSVEAMNAGTRAVSWDLWPNTRARGDAKVYVPTLPESRQKVIYSSSKPEIELPLPPSTQNGIFTFDTRLPMDAVAETRLSSKAYMTSSQGAVYAFGPQDLLILAAAPPDGAVHPEQAPVEIYQCVGAKREDCLLELEFHSAYKTLAPGESMQFVQAWRVVPYGGVSTPKAHREFIKSQEGLAQELKRLLESKK